MRLVGLGSDFPKPAANNFLFNMFAERLLRPWCQAVCQALVSGDEWILAPALQEWPMQERQARKQISAVSASGEAHVRGEPGQSLRMMTRVHQEKRRKGTSGKGMTCARAGSMSKQGDSGFARLFIQQELGTWRRDPGGRGTWGWWWKGSPEGQVGKGFLSKGVT